MNVSYAEVSFDERMATVEFRVGERAHITVDAEVCRSCTTKACVHACPAGLFVPTTDGGILFNCWLTCADAATWASATPAGRNRAVRAVPAGCP